ncbi:MAG: Fusaric acid resistance protein-like, partial [Phycisphaerales bacterium]|nr:Fusaric acid resistance protein-like [Phycisphaerales bacterium]
MIWLRSVISAPRRSTAQSLLAATFFAIQLGVAAAGVSIVYERFDQPGVTWAIVSAILVLYPGITQSLSAAFLRIAANLMGSAIGFGVGSLTGTHTAEIVLALAITIYVGELLRMDLALRTACVATVIVMSANDHNLTLTVFERLTAVAMGCGAALVVQLAGWP